MVSIEVEKGDRVAVSTGSEKWFYLWPAVGGAKLELWLQFQRFIEPRNLLGPSPFPLQLRGNIEVRQAPQMTSLWLCDLNVLMPVIPPATPTASQPFTAFVSDEQLRIMERLRWQNEAIQLAVNLSLTRPNGNGRLLSGMGTLTATVQPGDWLRELERVDAASYVELLVPVTENHARATAARRIREARVLLREGKNDPAIVSARAALEQIQKTSEVQALFKSAKDKRSKERSQDERWAMVVEAVYSLACGAAHDDEVTESFVYSRQDTEAIIAAIAGLVARYPAGSLQP